VAGIATDVTELNLARQREAEQAELLHAVFSRSPTPALRVASEPDGSWRVTAANAAMCRLLDVPESQPERCDLFTHVAATDREGVRAVLASAISQAAGEAAVPDVRQREVRLTAESGRLLVTLMSAAGLHGGGARGEAIVQFEDITARRAAEEALSDQAMRDPVTGLPNRRALLERMETALQRLRRRPGWVAVLFCDLDHFKDVNDSLGHQIGDRLLVEVADRLRSAVRPEDTVARLGGDEFVAMGEGIVDPSDAMLMALRLQDKLSSPWLAGEQVFRPQMSVGIAMTGDPDIGVDEMLRRADVAMYRAKAQGRNRIEVYERSVDEEVQKSVAIQHLLRRAIDSDGLVLHYQPIVRLSDRAIVGMEALVRMVAPDGTMMAPGEFVAQAESTGLVVPLGAWVLHRGLTDLERLHTSRGHHERLSVNVSPTQLREPGFATYLLEQLEFARVEPGCVAIEVTETALLHDPERSRGELRLLHEAGIGIALDDFGTGYSSLSWLTQFPLDTVKIDKSFTDELCMDPRKAAIVAAVISVSHELGFTVVAEGIENGEQVSRLIELGCDMGQGYLFGRPVPMGEPPWTM
jgi:diguanylate cyclase (GGDEF)-like protein